MRCPICQSPLQPTGVRALDRLVTGDGPFTVEECTACGYGATVPQLSEAELAPYYREEYYEEYYEHSQRGGASPLQRLRAWFRTWSAERRYRRRPYPTEAPAGRMLDVGCGAGDLLAHFAARGWTTSGIEPGAAAAAAAARRGARVHHGTLADHPWTGERFDLITFQHALEHIPDPLEALRTATALLAPGGRLLIAVPNWSSWQRRRLWRDRWVHLDLPRHQHHFSVRAFSRIAAELGLGVEDLGTTSTLISGAYSIHYLIAGRFTPGWRLWLAFGLGTLIFPLLLAGDRLWGGDCCFVVMRAAQQPGLN